MTKPDESKNNYPSGELELQQNIGYDEKIQFLVSATGEIKCISNAIGQELDEQNLILDEVDDQLDTVKGRLEKYNNQMKELTHSKQGPLLLISVILTIVFLFLFFWVIL
ncbi:hypothetical protein M9Y10_002889 [Tritrichomonas musculus]|uniref:t-SNARE coiled-coil homology domain-containing protein n=1 Tax=Tritrichomonas musculus TaxID=1915356 RepID=A0ABR2LB19_9EUKA